MRGLLVAGAVGVVAGIVLAFVLSGGGWRLIGLAVAILSLAALLLGLVMFFYGSRVALLTEDPRELSLPEAAFDVVLSLSCIHNIEDKAEQRNACFEVARQGRTLARRQNSSRAMNP